MTLPQVHDTVVHMLAAAFAAAPEREAMVCGSERVPYARYAAAVEGFARELSEQGVAGERVAILMPNSVDFPVALLAAFAAGAQVAPLNPAYTVHELRPVLADAAPRLVLAAPDVAERIAPLCAELGLPAPLAVGPGARRLVEIAGDPAALVMPDPDALGLLQYTGGTTGVPKGVDLTHRALAINVSQREAIVSTTPDEERALVITPLYHAYAMAMGLMLALYSRGTMVLLPRYSPEAALAMIEAERVTFFGGSPTIYHGLLACPRVTRTDFSTLALCFSGASALPEATLRRWMELTGASLCEGYGQTEAGPVLAANPRAGPHVAGSVGVPLPLTEIEIVDPATGEGPLPRGEAGEIRARGPQVMRGYRNRPEETAEALRDGWLHTGDIGAFRPDGTLEIRDRKKDMAIVSGFNVYPREIEEALLTHPAVAEAAAYAVPDARKGEVIHACVVAQGTDVASLEAHLAERLVRYKLPAELMLVPAIPKTAIGKIDKAALKAAAASRRAS
ncbi:AMP-binding protein [Salinarimonas ramus]|uniref:Long-chain-fatty-acid--CoA ligase n=1 Tax=Salinarimonas ramus TaxID=690164 RepID=A0A917V6I7_9HYPH|nr:AMP-binding protein [Salinarimonas ramus]GGK44071.1 long-chain-fatty-acid--CoA ligase [Salinarimonas ramus]